MSKLQQDMSLVSSNKAEIPDADESDDDETIYCLLGPVPTVFKALSLPPTKIKYNANKVRKYFCAKPGEKPYLSIYHSGTDLPTLRKIVKSRYLLQRPQDIKVICEYLFTVIATEPSILQEDWISCGRTVGLRGAKIGLRDMWDIKVTYYNLVIGQDLLDASEADDPWLCTLYLSAIRLSGSNNEEYKNRLMAAIFESIIQCGGPDNVSLVMYLKRACILWVECHQYQSLSAATDIYFEQFKKHRLAGKRTCIVEK